MRHSFRLLSSVLFLFAALSLPCFLALGQSLGSAGTLQGTVTDQSSAVVGNAKVRLHNPITGFQQTTTTGADGSFQFTNVPPNPYHLEVDAPGFGLHQQDVSVRSSVPINLKIQLVVAGLASVVRVEAGGNDLLENVPFAHTDLDKTISSKLPSFSIGSSLSDAITFTSPGVVADSNGFFHPLGDHAQVSFSVDGQPISDQQSKQFSTQLPLNAIQSMELITGAPSAEFGDKTSLVVNATTQSGLGKSKAFGSFALQYGSFGAVSEEASLGMGNARVGNFFVANAARSGRFLDTPELQPIHAVGNNQTFLDHFDFKPNSNDTFHMNLFVARNWFQIPNSYDQLDQDQRQKVTTWNFAPGYQHTFSANTLLTVNGFFRQDRVHYYPSGNPLNDSPATLAQERHLFNYGVKGDISYVRGVHNVKVGMQSMQTRLTENFTLGITDPSFNAICVDKTGDPQALPKVTDPSRCAALGFVPNPGLLPGLVPFDLTRGGKLFAFNNGRANINQFAFYAQDSITLPNGLSLNPGLRVDWYDGLSKATGVQPRMGVSYQLKRTSTVLRAAYSRLFETPYNENLVVSSATGAGGLATNVFGAFGSQPLAPGRRNQFNTGLQQSFGKYLLLDADYFWKYTDNAYDFDTLFSTPILFPISWKRSKLDGVSLRLSTPDVHGFQIYTTMGHTRARYFGPEVGGLIFNSPVSNSVFRIDHDQALQQTTHVRYQWRHDGPWVAFTWRYDSGLVAGAIASLEDALGLTAAQQDAISFFCGSQVASIDHPISSCSSNFGATRLRIPAAGTADDDHNPPRIAPRYLFDLGVGTDNLFHGDQKRVSLRFSVVNLTNKDALYNFLSTFSGTHFVTPRAYQGEVRFTF